MKPRVPGDMDDSGDPRDGADGLPDRDAGDALDEGALTELVTQFEGRLAAHGLSETYRDVLRGDVARFTSEAVRGSLDTLRTRVTRGGRPAHAMHRRFSSTIRVRTVLSIAAAVVVWFAVREYGTGRRTPVVSAAPVRDVATKRGERATLELMDGTRVILAPESRLRIPAVYATTTGLGARDVELNGEAYFEVKHDSAKPFRVRTAVGIAEDLGTAFVVTAYPETRGMRVLVASGEVAVHKGLCAHTYQSVRASAECSAARDTLRLRPLAVLQSGDLGQLDSIGMLNVKHGVDARKGLAWISGRLVFVGTPLPEVLAVLQRWHDVEFRLNDPALATLQVSADFDRMTSVQKVVEAFEVVLNVRAERHGRVVTLFAQSSRKAADRMAITPQGGTGIR